MMHIDADTIQALQIFKKEFHPSSHAIGKSKENMSLFSILDNTKSSPGKKLLQTWFLQPLYDKDMIEERLQHVSFLSDPKNESVTQDLQESLKKIADLPRIIEKIESVQSSVSDWRKLFFTLVNSLRIRQLCAQLIEQTDLPLFKKIFYFFVPRIEGSVSSSVSNPVGSAMETEKSPVWELINLLDMVIDWPESKRQKRLTIKSGIDEELDEMKQTYAGIAELLVSHQFLYIHNSTISRKV